MQNTTISNTTTRLLYLFLLIHLIGWTLAPALVRHNLPLDAIEGSIWGHQLEWGYDKNPFMNGWLTALATHLGGSSDWVVYFFSQISVVICLWCVWLIAKRMLPPAYALLSVLLLEGIQYYNFHSIDFNDNTLELGLWGLATYCFYRALRQAPVYWLFTGICAGLGIMTKYYTLALLAGMGLFLLTDKHARKQLATLAPWLGISLCALIILPHLLWLPQHDYITVRYMLERAASRAAHRPHIDYPLQFIWNQLLVFLPSVVLFLLFLIGKRPALALERHSISSFNKRFLFYVGLCPFLLTVLLAIIFDIQLRAGWGTPLQSLWGIILVALLQPAITAKKLTRAFMIVISLMCAMWIAYAISIFYSTDTATANFPGRNISERMTQIWHERYGTQLKYIAGSRWAGGNLGLYSPDKPAVMINWDERRSPWINVQDMQKNGAIFIWDITDHEKLPDDIRERFPRLGKAEVFAYRWKHNHFNLPAGEIGVAFMPPVAPTRVTTQ